MSDTHRQNAILQAIEILADKKISQASFDKTVKAVVRGLKDKATGEYLIKYQDSEFTAYATSSEKYYNIGEEVYVLVPGNDWSRVKTIIGSSNSKATTFVEVPVVGQNYNKNGMNLISLNSQKKLSSYKEDTLEGLNVTINNIAAKRYISQSDSIALGMTVKTSLASSQVGGIYGVIANLKFRNDDIIYEDEKDQNNSIIKTKEEKIQENAIIRPYTVSSRDVIGNPYGLTGWTYVETLIQDINIDQFLGIDSVQVFCNGFPLDKNKENIYDIFISNVYLFGAQALSQQDLNGYIVHIDYSQNGNVLYNIAEGGKIDDVLPVTAELKVKGKVVSKDVQYYWFRQNGLIFRGDPKYYSRAGEGWECLNAYAGASPIPLRTGDFVFNGSSKDAPGAAAALKQKVNKIRCVAVYENNAFTGDCLLYNHNLEQVVLTSSDLIDGINKTVYYLNNGCPTLTCSVYTWDGKPYISESPLTYTWYRQPRNGRAERLQESSVNLNTIRQNYQSAKQQFNNVSIASQNAYINSNPTYKTYKDQYEQYNKQLIINSNVCYNYPINSIVGVTKISCIVTKGDLYIGTASIVLQNRLEFGGMYSLSIDNGTQVFQYDNKGNSPTSSQLEKPFEIKPLTFTLIDDKGKEIPFEQIVNNGYVKWLLPKERTLLSTKEIKKFPDETSEVTATGQDRDFLIQGYDIYENLSSFSYQIKDNYDKKLNQNDIRLSVKYKDVILDAYTNFTFPKDGDPGTNGTDFVAKLSVSGTDRLYVRNDGLVYDDNGSTGKTIDFSFYNNSNKIENINTNELTWQCPPKNRESYYENIKSYLTVNSGNVRVIERFLSFDPGTVLNKFYTELPVDIVRAKYKLGDISYYAEYPICYSYNVNANDKTKPQYRFKIKPKTGFKYVVYSQDGTRPDYDNTLPFEIIVEEYVADYWIRILDDNLSYNWKLIGNFLERQEVQDLPSYKAWFKPVDNFDGLELYSAIVCEVRRGNEYLGFIHVPIYMILNRYGHQALNEWDGNSIQLNGAGNTILAPQIGAGQKENDNSFTGVFMGTINGLEQGEVQSDQNRGIKQSDDYKIGFAGYNHGARTIFLDSKTGKAQFGKNNAGRIILDPSNRIGIREGNKVIEDQLDAALIYSGNYPIADFLTNKKTQYDVELVGEKYKDDRDNKGLLIDFSTPQIGFGSGNFTVTKEGYITVKGGGHIAGWSILDDQLHYHNEVGMASKNKEVPFKDLLNKNIKDTEGKISDTIAFWAGGVPTTNDDSNKTKPGDLIDANFYATHGGFIYGKLGQIAGWNFADDKTFYHTYKDQDGNVRQIGMNADPDNKTYKLDKWPDGKSHKAKAFFANGNNFYVTHDGYLRSTFGKIAAWDIDTKTLSNGATGLGDLNLNEAANKVKTNFGETNITARFWSHDNDGIAFVVSSDGKLYSRAGKIGGWTISKDSLTAQNSNKQSITINSDGSIYSGAKNSKKGNWGISANGAVYFNNGHIGGIVIEDDGIYEANASGKKLDTGWYIKHGEVRFPGLKVTEKNYVTYAGGASGGSGVTGHGAGIGGSAGQSYINPNTVRTDYNSAQTLKGYFHQLVADIIYAGDINAGKLTIFKNFKVDKEGNATVSDSAITASSNGLTLDVPLAFTDGIYPSGFAGQCGLGKKKTKQIKFNNDTYITVCNGIVIQAKDVDGTVHKEF